MNLLVKLSYNIPYDKPYDIFALVVEIVKNRYGPH